MSRRKQRPAVLLDLSAHRAARRALGPAEEAVTVQSLSIADSDECACGRPAVAALSTGAAVCAACLGCERPKGWR